MSSIIDWAADYTGADTNTPTHSTDVPFPADGTTDLGVTLRDIKKVAREESLNKGWEADPRTGTRVSSYALNFTGNLTTSYPLGTAIKIDNSGYKYTHVVNTSYSAPNTLVTVGADISALGAGTYTCVFGAYKPPIDPVEMSRTGVTTAVGSSIPWRVEVMGFFRISGTSDTERIFFPQELADDAYVVLVQALYSSGSPAEDSYSFRISAQNSASFVCKLLTAPGGSIVNTYMYCVVRGT